MTTASESRILELWPKLSEEHRNVLIEIAESSVDTPTSIQLTGDELAALERSKADFAAGRVLDWEEMKSRLDAAIMKRRRERSELK